MCSVDFEADVLFLSREMHCSPGIVRELLTLAGGDVGLVVDSSVSSDRLSLAKARIVDKRLADIEARLVK